MVIIRKALTNLLQINNSKVIIIIIARKRFYLKKKKKTEINAVGITPSKKLVHVTESSD